MKLKIMIQVSIYMTAFFVSSSIGAQQLRQALLGPHYWEFKNNNDNSVMLRRLNSFSGALLGPISIADQYRPLPLKSPSSALFYTDPMVDLSTWLLEKAYFAVNYIKVRPISFGVCAICIEEIAHFLSPIMNANYFAEEFAIEPIVPEAIALFPGVELEWNDIGAEPILGLVRQPAVGLDVIGPLIVNFVEGLIAPGAIGPFPEIRLPWGGINMGPLLNIIFR